VFWVCRKVCRDSIRLHPILDKFVLIQGCTHDLKLWMLVLHCLPGERKKDPQVENFSARQLTRRSQDTAAAAPGRAVAEGRNVVPVKKVAMPGGERPKKASVREITFARL
jgi:hypothetical protein